MIYNVDIDVDVMFCYQPWDPSHNCSERQIYSRIGSIMGDISTLVTELKF